MLLFDDSQFCTENVTICGIYRWLFPNGKCYIGQSNCVLHRVSEELRFFRRDRSAGLSKLFHAYKKHGERFIKILLIETCSPEILGERETYYIDKFDSYKNGYNSTRGNEKKYGPLTDEGKIKIRESLREYWTTDKCEEWSEKMKMWMKDNLSDEKIQELKHIGRDFYKSKENREFHKQRTKEGHTPEVIKRQGETLKNTLANRGSWLSKPITLKLNGESITFHCSTDCTKHCGMTYSTLQRLRSGELKHVRGWCLPETDISQLDISDGIYKLRSPRGEVHIFYNLKNFSKKIGLDRSTICAIMRKKNKKLHPSGWTAV